MQPSELEAIRADIRAAVVDAQFGDRSLLPDLLDYLMTALGRLSTDTYAELQPLIHGTENHVASPVAVWADGLLRECQIRAVSQIPFAEADYAGPELSETHWRDHLD